MKSYKRIKIRKNESKIKIRFTNIQHDKNFVNAHYEKFSQLLRKNRILKEENSTEKSTLYELVIP